ncbi:hypothetical protein B0H17DRAFT_1134877 [Mycena rosella]|uniref:Uncharacterized protein n=1 Tax=Mycena rosella TaxID=1033263 RepID=A0AAD7DEW9_MYCRO|nr:hypothetical protein B0H17DRAFT_1134877 [Mycena rosella]
MRKDPDCLEKNPTHPSRNEGLTLASESSLQIRRAPVRLGGKDSFIKRADRRFTASEKHHNASFRALLIFCGVVTAASPQVKLDYAAYVGTSLAAGVNQFLGMQFAARYIIPMLGVEFWNFAEPSTMNTTKECTPSGEDPTCSDSIPSTGVNPAHYEALFQHWRGDDFLQLKFDGDSILSISPCKTRLHVPALIFAAEVKFYRKRIFALPSSRSREAQFSIKLKYPK